MDAQTHLYTLKAARQLAGFTQAQLAEVVGVARPLICNLENGRLDPAKVSHGTIVRIVRALQRRGLKAVTVEALFPHSRVA